MTAAIFLDRDDTILMDTGYMHKLDDFAWRKGAEDSLRLFHQLGLPIFVITNQGGIGRGFFTETQMHAFHEKLFAEARILGAEIKDIALCPHHPLAVSEELRTPCKCRKPEPGMLLALAEKWQIDLPRSVVIGDKPSDIGAGQAVGCASFLVGPDQSLLDVAKTALTETNFIR